MESRSDCWGEVCVSRGHPALSGQFVGKRGSRHRCQEQAHASYKPLRFQNKGNGRPAEQGRVVDGGRIGQDSPWGSLCAWIKWGSRGGPPLPAPLRLPPSPSPRSTRNAGSGLKDPACCADRTGVWAAKGSEGRLGPGPCQPTSDSACDQERPLLPLEAPTSPPAEWGLGVSMLPEGCEVTLQEPASQTCGVLRSHSCMSPDS